MQQSGLSYRPIFSWVKSLSRYRWNAGNQMADIMEIKGAKENNLKNVNVKFPLGMFIAVTGVSGSGKSTLINEVLHKTLAQKLNKAKANLVHIKKL